MDADDLNKALNDVMQKGADLRQALPVLSTAFASGSSRLEERADSAMFDLARSAASTDMEWLEQQVSAGEHELAARVLLLWLYFTRRHSEFNHARRCEHIFWLIEKAPSCPSAGRPPALILNRDDPENYANFRERWLNAVGSHKDNAAVLVNAARVLQLSDDKLAEELFGRAIALDPTNAEARDLLAHLHSRKSRGNLDPCHRESARKAYQGFQEALWLKESQIEKDMAEASRPNGQTDARDPEQQRAFVRSRSLPELARAAFETGEIDTAESLASELLTIATGTMLPQYFRNDGDAIHHGHLVLGRVALLRGNVSAAKDHLLEAGKTKGSPVLQSFGPNMQLAQDLLAIGEKEVVLQYFELCGAFWKRGEDRLEIWTRNVREGKQPAFGANLRY